MPDDPAFIRMIAAEPEDDAPRLVYADVLEERGDPASTARAEFIRVQCERARLVPDTPRSRELWFRDAALLDWARQWRAELPATTGIEYGGFIRGFIDQITGDSESVAGALRLVVDHVPLRKLTLTRLSLEWARALAQSPALGEVVELDLRLARWEIDLPGIILAFARRGPWPRLRRLRADWVPAGGESMIPAWRREWAEFRAAFGDRLTT